MEDKGLDRRSKVACQSIDESDLLGSPELTETELRDMTMGVFKLKQADFDTEEYTTETGQNEKSGS